MRKKELIKQLQNLKGRIKPDALWLEKNRGILLSQLKAQTSQVGFEFGGGNVFLRIVKKTFALTYKPLVGMAIVLLVVFGSWIATVSATKNSLPGGFLYNVKLTTERIQVNFVFDDEEKTNLEIKFADRRLEEIRQIVSQDSNDPKNRERLEVPLKKFQESMANVNMNLAKIEIKDQQKAVEIANILDSKAQEYVEALKEQQGNMTESAVAEKTDNAINVSKNTGERALDLMIRDFEAGQSRTLPDEISNKISDRIDSLEKEIEKSKADIKKIIINKVVIAKEAREAAKDEEEAGAIEAESGAEIKETDEQLEKVDLAEEEMKEESTPEEPKEPAEKPAAEVLPSIEDVEGEPDKAYELLQQARLSLRNMQLSKAFELIKEADKIIVSTNKVISANRDILRYFDN